MYKEWINYFHQVVKWCWLKNCLKNVRIKAKKS